MRNGDMPRLRSESIHKKSQTMIFDIKQYESVDSTNNEAARAAMAGAPEGTVIVARNQSAGRGQRNNTWESNPGENLMFTVILRPAFIAADKLFLISKAFGLAVVKAMADKITCRIKWPNDIYVNDKKIAGILLEHSFMGNTLSSSIIGMGLNINQREFKNAPNATSLLLETGQTTDFAPVMASILEFFSEFYEQLKAEDYSAIRSGYFDNLYRKTGCHSYSTPEGESFKARIADIYDSGELVLETESNETRIFRFKEVTLL